MTQQSTTKTTSPSGVSARIDQRAFCVTGFEERGTWRGKGTGFCFLRRNWIVTAKHNVFDKDGLARNGLAAAFGDEHGLWTIPFRSVFVYQDLDVALLELVQDCPCEHPLMPAHWSLRKSCMAICGGFDPPLSDVTLQHMTINLTAIRHIQLDELEREFVEMSLTFKNDEVKPGFSGAPLLIDGGGVVGVLYRIETDEEAGVAHVRATAIDPLLGLLRLPSPTFQFFKYRRRRRGRSKTKG